jgi:hypothetical protein
LLRSEYPDCSKSESSDQIAVRCALDPLRVDLVEHRASTIVAGLYVAIDKLLSSERSAHALDRDYGIKAGFLGTGYTMTEAGAGKSVVLPNMLEQSVVSEYLVKNVPLKGSPCQCLRVRPYVSRQQDKLDPDTIAVQGGPSCPIADVPQ